MFVKSKKILAVLALGISIIFSGFAEAGEDVLVHKFVGCMCCENWADHLREHGHTVTVMPDENIGAYKDEMQVPEELKSCHTATVGGYVVEGHVPAADIMRLLSERPDAIGLAVGGMPAGSPGMEMGERQDPYDVILFKADGTQEVYASY